MAVRQKAMTRAENPTQSCGCLASERASERHWRGHGELSQHYWHRLEHHAKQRNLEFSITIEETWDLFLAQGRRCKLSGLEIEFGRYRPKERFHGNWPRLGTASLDRIDSSLGYVPGNIQWVHKEVNRMKGNLSDERFVGLCRLISETATTSSPT